MRVTHPPARVPRPAVCGGGPRRRTSRHPAVAGGGGNAFDARRQHHRARLRRRWSGPGGTARLRRRRRRQGPIRPCANRARRRGGRGRVRISGGNAFHGAFEFACSVADPVERPPSPKYEEQNGYLEHLRFHGCEAHQTEDEGLFATTQKTRRRALTKNRRRRRFRPFLPRRSHRGGASVRASKNGSARRR